VPAGFTTEVWDRVRDPEAPKTATGGGGHASGRAGSGQAPGRHRFRRRPFDEPTLLKIASAYEAATKHRTPPAGFGPLPGEP